MLHASISLSLLAQHHLASFIITGCSEGGKYKSIEMLRRAEGAVGVCFCLLLCDIKQPLFEEGVRGCFSTALTTVSMDRAALQTPRSCDPGQITCDFKKVHWPRPVQLTKVGKKRNYFWLWLPFKLIRKAPFRALPSNASAYRPLFLPESGPLFFRPHMELICSADAAAGRTLWPGAASAECLPLRLEAVLQHFAALRQSGREASGPAVG